MSAEQRTVPLDEARGIITKDRNAAYGDPEDNFKSIAAFWTVWLQYRHGLPIELDTHDIAIMMDLMKTGRIATGAPLVKDNYVDSIGYKAIAWEQALFCYGNDVPKPEPEAPTKKK